MHNDCKIIKRHSIRSILTALLASTLAMTIVSSPALAQDAPEAAKPDTATPEAAAPEAATPEAAPDDEGDEPETPALPTGPSEEDMLKAKEHFMKGRELFDAKDFESAVDEFKESYKLSKNSVLLYNIAFTHDEIGDKQMATFYYEKFLRDTDKSVANRDVAKKRLRVLKKESAGTDTEPTAATVTAFKHAVVDESPPNTPLDIVATVPEGVPWRVVVNYRPAGQPKFVAVEMRYRFKELVARIPASHTKGKNIQYYIEVRDGSGKVLERSGQPTSPHIVYMEPGAKPRYYADSVTGPVTATPGILDTELTTTTTPNNDGGWLDAGSSKFNKLKWGTTGSAVGLIAASTVFYLVSSNYSSELEKEALQSRAGQCPTGPPCKQFAQKQKDLLSLGGTYETLGTVALGLGIATAAAAGTLWYLDITNDGKESDALTTIPVVGNDYIGAAASMRF